MCEQPLSMMAQMNKQPLIPPKQIKQTSLTLMARESPVCLLTLPAVCSPEAIKMQEYSLDSCGFSLRQLIYFEHTKR